MRGSASRTLEQVEVSLRSRVRRYQAEHSPRRGRYPDDFKREIVALLRSGIDVAELARRIEIPQATIQKWQSTVSLDVMGRPPCRPLRVVDDTLQPEKVPPPIVEVERGRSTDCIIRLSGGVEIVLASDGIDERLLRTVLRVMA